MKMFHSLFARFVLGSRASGTLAALFTLASLAAILAPSTAAADKADAEQHLAAGDEAYAGFDNREALKHYRKAYAADANRYDTLMKLARALNDVGEGSKGNAAEKYFQEAVDLSTRLTQAYPDRAEGYFMRAASTGNLALFVGGKRKVTLSRDIEAMGRKCIQLDPDYSQGYVVLGIYYREVANLNWLLRQIAQKMLGGLPSGTLEDSEKMLKKGVELDPEAIYPRYQLAVTLEELKKKTEAKEQYREILKLKKTDHLDDEKIAIARQKLGLEK